MSYIIKYVDEYGVEKYESEDDKILTFNTVDDAKAKAKELLNDEFEVFGEALTDYYVVSIEETEKENVEYFTNKVDEDNQFILLSANKAVIDYLNEVESSLIDAGCVLEKKRTYANGSVISKLSYTDDAVLDLLPNDEDEEEYSVQVSFDDGKFLFVYNDADINCYADIQSVIATLTYKLKEVHPSVISAYDKGEWLTMVSIDKKYAEEHYDEIMALFESLMENTFKNITEE